ncbi:MAG TPA: PQQ-dependent sugar dehydrogenase [Panacibacter sp.]|nr:PQQ-dependent sugar dehydrogenase [Panacibacter sp.]
MKHLRLLFIVILSSAFITACNSGTQKETIQEDTPITAGPDSVKLQLITSAINTPVEMNAAPDNTHRLFFTDVSGKILILQNDSIITKPFLDIRNRLEQKDTSLESRGMFSIAFHPQFATNGKFYVCYNAPTLIKENVCKLVVSEFTTDKNDPAVADTSSERRVIEVEGKQVQGFGAEIAFGPDGYLYISIGDLDIGDTTHKYVAQDLNELAGKLLRIDVDKTPYAIPADNPFVGKDTRPEIWAYGFRKLWRFSFDKRTNRLFGGDVGEQKREEINIVQKGANYGWPVKEGDTTFKSKEPFNDALYTSPINTYSHDVGVCAIGGSFYYGTAIPSLKNKYVFADFNGNIFTLTDDEQHKWLRQPVKIINSPKDPFLITSYNIDENNEPYVMGVLNAKDGLKGVVYKIVKG